MGYSKESKGSGPAMKTMQAWLRQHGGLFQFTTAQARQAGLGKSYTSSVLTWLSQDPKSGLFRTRASGLVRYDPEYDEGLISKDVMRLSPEARAGSAPAHRSKQSGTMASVARTLYENPGIVYDSVRMAEVTGHLRNSCVSAMARLAERDPGIRRLSSGVYVREVQPEPFREDGEGSGDAPLTSMEEMFDGLRNKPGVPAIQVPTQPSVTQDWEQPPRAPLPEIGLPAAGELLEVIGSGTSGTVLVRSQGGQVFRLEEL